MKRVIQSFRRLKDDKTQKLAAKLGACTGARHKNAQPRIRDYIGEAIEDERSREDETG